MVVVKIQTEIGQLLYPLRGVRGVCETVVIQCGDLGGLSMQLLGLDQLSVASFYWHPSQFPVFYCSSELAIKCSIDPLVLLLQRFHSRDVVTLLFDSSILKDTLTVAVAQGDFLVNASIDVRPCRETKLTPPQVVFPVIFDFASSTLAKIVQFFEGQECFKVQAIKNKLGMAFNSGNVFIECQPLKVIKKDLCCNVTYQHAQTFKTFIEQGALSFESVQLSYGPDLPITVQFAHAKNTFSLTLSSSK
jgi:hypothetical protein